MPSGSIPSAPPAAAGAIATRQSRPKLREPKRGHWQGWTSSRPSLLAAEVHPSLHPYPLKAGLSSDSGDGVPVSAICIKLSTNAQFGRNPGLSVSLHRCVQKDEVDGN